MPTRRCTWRATSSRACASRCRRPGCGWSATHRPRACRRSRATRSRSRAACRTWRRTWPRPLRSSARCGSGAGMKNKVLEALAMGCPLVATPLSVDGIAVTNGHDAIVARDDELAAAAVRVLRDAALRSRLSANGRALIEQRYSWQRVAQLYEALYRDVQRPIRRVTAGRRAARCGGPARAGPSGLRGVLADALEEHVVAPGAGDAQVARGATPNGTKPLRSSTICEPTLCSSVPASRRCSSSSLEREARRSRPRPRWRRRGRSARRRPSSRGSRSGTSGARRSRSRPRRRARRPRGSGSGTRCPPSRSRSTAVSRAHCPARV